MRTRSVLCPNSMDRSTLQPPFINDTMRCRTQVTKGHVELERVLFPLRWRWFDICPVRPAVNVAMWALT